MYGEGIPGIPPFPLGVLGVLGVNTPRIPVPANFLRTVRWGFLARLLCMHNKTDSRFFWHVGDQVEWMYRGHSRRLRKLYRELSALELARQRVSETNWVPEHAPSTCTIIREKLKPLNERLFDLQNRIAALQNDEDWWDRR